MRKTTIARGGEVSGTAVDCDDPAVREEATVPGVAEPADVVRQRGGRLLLAGIAVAMVVVGVVIGLDVLRDEPAPPPRVEEPPVATTVPALTEEQKIVAAYRKYDEVDGAALTTGNPDHPLYSAYATGAQLEAAREAVRRLRDQGIVLSPPTVREVQITVESIDGDRARIRVCAVDDGFPVRADTGEPLAPRRLATTLMTGDMVKVDGSWKAAYMTKIQQWEGRAGCAVE